MDTPCQTCGDVGWRELLVTCSKCSVALEHCYCIRKHSFERPRDWVCIDCSRRSVQAHLYHVVCDSHGNSPRRVKTRGESSNPVPKWKKIPETVRVKLISTEEAIKLSSGAARKGFRSNNEGKMSPSGTAVGFTRQTNTGHEAKRLNFATGILKLNPSSPQINTVGSPRGRAQQMCARDTKQATKAPEGLKGKRATVRCSGESNSQREQQAAAESAIEIGTSYDGTKNAYDTMDHDARDRWSSPLVRTAVECRQSLPALDPAWKGGFLDSAPPIKFFGGFRAQPPCVVHHKVYDFSKMMPVVLKVELLPVGHLLKDLLRDENPDLSDIGLYFFPDENIERAEENHAHLFENMATNNAMIRSNINGTDLLIFTSRILDENSQGLMEMFNARNFLWGIFIRTENLPQTSIFNSVDMSEQCVTGIGIATGGDNFASSRQSTVLEVKPANSSNKIREDSVPPGFETIPAASVDVCKQFAIGMGIDKEEDNFISSKQSTGFQVTAAKSSTESKEDSVPSGFEPIPTASESKNSSSSAEVPERIIQECPATLFSKKVEGVWMCPPNNWVKLNIQGISSSGLSGAAGVIRDESGKWVCGYLLNLINTSLFSAELWGLFQGLVCLWERGFRKVLVELTNPMALEALRTYTTQLSPRNSLVKHCKELMQRNWDCRISIISRKQNSCAVWLGDRLESHPTGLVLFTDPPRGLVPLLETERLVSATSTSPTLPSHSKSDAR